MEKIEYITNQFKKTFGKKYENYCITRIYSLVKRNDLKIVTQQLFKRKNKKIALADLYLPQINMWIEIDEGQHEKQIVQDKNRTIEVLEENKTEEIIKIKYNALDEVIFTNIEEPYRIKVYDTSLEEINNQIDNIVRIINEKIKDENNKYIPWKKVESNPQDYIDKGAIAASDNAKFRTLDDIGLLFNNNSLNYNQKMHAYINIKDNYWIWSPTLKINGEECENNSWENEISDDGEYIFENQKERDINYLKSVFERNDIRFVFPKYKDADGCLCRKFIGVYKIDIEQSKEKNIRIWKRVETKINLNEFNKKHD